MARRNIQNKNRPWRINNLHQTIATAAALFTILSAIAAYLYTQFYKAPDLTANIQLRYTGHYLTITNLGNITSEDNYLRIVFWRHGAPAPDFESYEQIMDLPPGTDYALRIDYWKEALKHGHDNNKVLHTFGYIVVSASNITTPKAWAFHVCWNGFSDEGDECDRQYDSNGNALLAQFRYPNGAPNIGQAVNYPETFVDYGWFPK